MDKILKLYKENMPKSRYIDLLPIQLQRLLYADDINVLENTLDNT